MLSEASECLRGVTVSILLHNPLTEGLPLLVPLLQTLGLNAVAILSKVDITKPFNIVLIFEVAPADAVVRERSLVLVSIVLFNTKRLQERAYQASKTNVIESLDCLIEVVAQTSCVLAKDRRVVVADGGRDTMGNHCREGMVKDIGGQTQDFVRDRADFHHDTILDHLINQPRVLVQGETVSDTACTEEDGIEQVFVGRVSIAESFARVEEERNREVRLLGLLLEPDQFGCHIGKRTAQVFLSDHIVA